MSCSGSASLHPITELSIRSSSRRMRIVPRTVGNVAWPVLAEPRGVGGRARVARAVAAVRIGRVKQIAARAVGLPHVVHSLPTRAVGCDEVVRDDHTLRTPADNDPAQAPPNHQQQRQTEYAAQAPRNHRSSDRVCCSGFSEQAACQAECCVLRGEESEVMLHVVGVGRI